MNKLDYYKAPSQEIFEDIKRGCLEIWGTYDDAYGYASEKKDVVNRFDNIRDNCLTMVAMFDVHNMKRLLRIVSEPSCEWLEPFLKQEFEAEKKLREMGIYL